MWISFVGVPVKIIDIYGQDAIVAGVCKMQQIAAAATTMASRRPDEFEKIAQNSTQPIFVNTFMVENSNLKTWATSAIIKTTQRKQSPNRRKFAHTGHPVWYTENFFTHSTYFILANDSRLHIVLSLFTLF
jgi:hypothetical protein